MTAHLTGAQRLYGVESEGELAELSDAGGAVAATNDEPAEFGNYVHEILKRVDLSGADLESVARTLARRHGVTDASVTHAIQLVERVLRLPLMDDARSATRVFREVPVAGNAAAGRVNGKADLLFERRGAWRVVEFKTDRLDDPDSLREHAAQLAGTQPRWLVSSARASSRRSAWFVGVRLLRSGESPGSDLAIRLLKPIFILLDEPRPFSLGEFSRRLQRVARIAQRKLQQLHAARELRDLAAFPGNRLEALAGDRRGQHSIRVNDQVPDLFCLARWGCLRCGDRGLSLRKERMMARRRRLARVHPGEILRDDLMAPLGLSINGLARDLRVPVTRMSEIVNGRRSITADTALRLARYFAMTPQFWMNLQAAYDLDVATRASADRIKRDVHPREAA